MSSMRNAVARRPHRERAQPASREKWGILEKHKDYSLRAKDYNVKKKKLAQLSQKAREKNPDEFAFGMLSQGKAGLGKHKSSTKDGVPTGPLSHDAVKLLKTQDAGYLRTVAAKGRKEIERVKEEVGLDSVTLGGKAGSHKRFSDEDTGFNRSKKRTADGEVLETAYDIAASTMAEVEARASTLLQEMADPENEPDMEKPKPKSKKALLAEQDASARLRTERKKRKRLQEMRVAKLEALKKRQREILVAADQLELQRAKMARTVGGVNKNGVKFKIRERKK
jgi:U3 small nucleolar RNA-associated protein 11